MPQLRLSLLGGFQSHLADSPLVGFQSDKARALLVYLAVEADRPHGRARLAGLFWPDWDDKQARTYVRHALANLRKILGDTEAEQPFLLVTPQSIQFNVSSHHRLDVADLLAALDVLPAQSEDSPSADHLARLQAAVAGGERLFLDGFFLGDCPAFEEWLLLNRERIQRRVLVALRYLADGFEQKGELARACTFAQQCISLEPWREEAHRQLMHLLVRSGQRGAALAQYESCRRLLRAELNVEPGKETTTLYRDILAGEFDESPLAARPGVSPQSIPSKPTTPQHNLSAEPTPLVGRDETIRVIQHLFTVEHARLVTLTGPGGVGKTRLGLAVARAMLPDFPDGVFFAELAPVRDAELVLPALAEILGVRNNTIDRPLLEAILEHLRGKHLLLLVDNFEHVAKVASLLADLLAGCPYVKMLVTSRTVLYLRGEFEFVVPPLALPKVDGMGKISQPEADALASALELFRQRALAANHRFVLDQTNISLAARICARLDCLPLAIELAAARLKYMSLPDLLAGLAVGEDTGWLHSLKVDLQDAPERQRSLWATVAWSYDLLGTEVQFLFRRLSVFVGGWTAEIAVDVCGEGLGLDVEDGLAALADIHLIVLVPDAPSGARYGMLETIREFGLAQLQRYGELPELQRRHAVYFRELVERLEPELRTQNSRQTIAYLRMEYSNIRVALGWAIGQKDVEICLAFGDALQAYWNQHGQKDAQVYLEQILLVVEGAPPSMSYVHTLVSAGYFACILGIQPRGRLYLERAIAMDQTIGEEGNAYKMGIAYGLLRSYQKYAGEYTAANASLEANLKRAYAAGDDWNLAIILANTGIEVAYLGQFERAAVLVDEGLTLFRRLGEKWGIGLAVIRRGVLYRMTGDFAQAKRFFQKIIEPSKNPYHIGHITSAKINLAIVAEAEGDDRQAATLLLEVLKDAQNIAVVNRCIDSIGKLAHLATKNTLYADALSLASVVASFYGQRNLVLPPLERREQEELIALARSHLSEEAADVAWQVGALMTIEEAAVYAEEVFRSLLA